MTVISGTREVRAYVSEKTPIHVIDVVREFEGRHTETLVRNSVKSMLGLDYRCFAPNSRVTGQIIYQVNQDEQDLAFLIIENFDRYQLKRRQKRFLTMFNGLPDITKALVSIYWRLTDSDENAKVKKCFSQCAFENGGTLTKKTFHMVGKFGIMRNLQSAGFITPDRRFTPEGEAVFLLGAVPIGNSVKLDDILES